MLGHYRAVFRAPGSAAFAAAAFVMRMPIAIYPIAIVLIISARDGRYGFAGVLAACYTFGGAVGMPATSVLVDRLGQRRVLVPGAVLHGVATATLAVLLRTSASHAVLVAPAVLVGVTYLSAGSLVRARWSHAWAGRAELGTAMSLESVLDELIFVIGPLIATVIATQAVPVLTLYVALTLVVVGSLALAVQQSSEPPVHPRDGESHPFALRARGMLLLTIVTIPMGAVFASAEVSLVAYCGQHGHRGLSGLALAVLAGGSGVSGLLYGAREHRRGAAQQFLRTALVFSVLPVVLFTAVDIPVLVVAAFVLGAGIAPTLISAFALVQQIVPARSLTEGLSWITTGLSVGYGLGASVVGGVADAHGARTAFVVVLASAVLVGLLALLLERRLRGADHRVPQPAGVAP